ncbi:hypothetical protein [Polyangium sp. y55x31]|uniref:hypothetical protein n=1 Tax=Polyangium sp. y55x31 TaxID=3042688 RepID=UPI002482BA04|nr:hypothetical protein [Polyangium sp. y55x31]MDI1476806.1 hypothetical protein [Polyangium sp. y55x31]
MVTLSLEGALEAGRMYRSTGAISSTLLRPHVLRSWERSHLGGADPRRPRAEGLGTLDVERLRDRQDALVRAAQPYMQALSRASGRERHAAMLGDSQAVVLDVLGDQQTIHGPERVPGPGALLDEAACGTNGIGTAIAENGYVELVGPEHFIEGFQAFTCQGIPLRDGTGAMAGVLSVSVRRPEVVYRLREIMLCAAHGIEMDLLAARLEGDLERVLVARDHWAEALDRLLGDIVQAQAAVRLRLAFAAEELSSHRLTHARELLALATTLLEQFRRHAALWRVLARDEAAAPRPIQLDALVRDLLELLRTEASVRNVEIVLCDIESVVVDADPNTLARWVFRSLIGAMRATRGGAIRVDLYRSADGAALHIFPVPGPGMAQASLAPLKLVVPGRLILSPELGAGIDRTWLSA